MQSTELANYQIVIYYYLYRKGNTNNTIYALNRNRQFDFCFFRYQGAWMILASFCGKKRVFGFAEGLKL